jgi:pyrroloquinoline quinone biosynthesis protein D
VALTAQSRPRLTSKARLRYDRIADETLLLFPEHALRLNESAGAILYLCDGRTTAEIAAELAAPLDDVVDFLAALVERGLVHA